MGIPHVFRIDEVKALSDEVRITILDMLSKRPMSVQEITEELKKRGFNKSINAVRYHIKLLKESGLINLVKVVEVRGGVLKYYATSKDVYLYEEPKNIDELLKPFIDSIKDDVKRIILRILEEKHDEIVDTAKNLKPCPYCYTEHFVEHIILESFKGAVGEALKDEEVRELISKYIKGE